MGASILNRPGLEHRFNAINKTKRYKFFCRFDFDVDVDVRLEIIFGIYFMAEGAG